MAELLLDQPGACIVYIYICIHVYMTFQSPSVSESALSPPLPRRTPVAELLLDQHGACQGVELKTGKRIRARRAIYIYIHI